MVSFTDTTSAPSEQARVSVARRPWSVWRAAVLLLALGMLVSAAALAMIWRLRAPTDRAALRAHAPPGTIVPGAVPLHLWCTGARRAGRPTLLLDAGLGEFSLVWTPLQRRLSARYRVCAYDRPGYGWSPPTPAMLNADQMTAALHAALRAHGESPSWIVVGHSLGGWYAEAFASRHADEVAGVVLLDASHPQQEQRLDATTRRALRVYRAVMAVLPTLARLGVLSLLEWPARGYAALPVDAFEVFAAFASARPHHATANAELQAFARFATASPVPAAAVPHVVVTAADTTSDFGRAWFALQHERTRAVRAVQHEVWPEVSHLALVADAAVAERIAALIDRVAIMTVAPPVVPHWRRVN